MKHMLTLKGYLVTFFLALFFFGCAGLQPSVPEPTVSINSFKVLPSNSIAPRFEINLRIVNTARTALNIEGIVYTLIEVLKATYESVI